MGSQNNVYQTTKNGEKLKILKAECVEQHKKLKSFVVVLNVS
jgi:hypothetical protein